MPDAIGEVSALAGKYLTFGLNDEHYAIEILRVQEIVGLLPVTRVPRLPRFVAGVVNLRGRVIPVIDLRLAFGLEASARTDRTCIIVVRTEGQDGAAKVMGALVDEVSDVVNLMADVIEQTPEFGADVDTSFVKGVGRLEDRVVLLLDVDMVVSGKQMDLVQSAAEAMAEDALVEGSS